MRKAFQMSAIDAIRAQQVIIQDLALESGSQDSPSILDYTSGRMKLFNDSLDYPVQNSVIEPLREIANVRTLYGTQEIDLKAENGSYITTMQSLSIPEVQADIDAVVLESFLDHLSAQAAHLETPAQAAKLVHHINTLFSVLPAEDLFNSAGPEDAQTFRDGLNAIKNAGDDYAKLLVSIIEERALKSFSAPAQADLHPALDI